MALLIELELRIKQAGVHELTYLVGADDHPCLGGNARRQEGRRLKGELQLLQTNQGGGSDT